MKKLMMSVLALSLVAGLQAKLDFVSFDAAVVYEKSKESQLVSKKIRQEYEALAGFAENSKKELAKLQDEISTKAEVLSKEALQEKTEQLASKKRELERKLNDRQEAFQAFAQKENSRLREKQMAVINKVFAQHENEWGALAERNAGGLVCVSKAIDKTNEIVEALDLAYDAEKNATGTAKKGSAKPVKREIKAA